MSPHRFSSQWFNLIYTFVFFDVSLVELGRLYASQAILINFYNIWTQSEDLIPVKSHLIFGLFLYLPQTVFMWGILHVVLHHGLFLSWLSNKNCLLRFLITTNRSKEVFLYYMSFVWPFGCSLRGFFSYFVMLVYIFFFYLFDSAYHCGPLVWA